MDKAKILLIDDEEDFVGLMRKKLETDGYAVISASDGEEGIAMARKEEPDLVICDLTMPKKDGFEVLKALRQDKRFKAPFIMLTNIDDFDKVKRAYECEADFYVPKTVALDKLMAKIRTLINISRSRIW